MAQTGLGIFDKITLLVSNRSEIEKLFGQPMKDDRDLYDTEDFRVSVSYSRGRCSEVHPADLFDVPKDTVWKLLIGQRRRLNCPNL